MNFWGEGFRDSFRSSPDPGRTPSRWRAAVRRPQLTSFQALLHGECFCFRILLLYIPDLQCIESRPKLAMWFNNHWHREMITVVWYARYGCISLLRNWYWLRVFRFLCIGGYGWSTFDFCGFCKVSSREMIFWDCLAAGYLKELSNFTTPAIKCSHTEQVHSSISPSPIRLKQKFALENDSLNPSGITQDYI